MNMKKRFSLFVLVFLALSATWATRNTFEGLPPTVCLDMPEGFTIAQSSGSNSFQLKNKYCPVSAVVQIVPSKGKTAEEFSGDKLKALGAETQSSAYQWRERTVCLSTVDGSIGGESSRGYALSVPYENSMIFLMVWCQSQSADAYENFMASFIDALYVDSESFFQTGPFTQFLYPPSGKRKAVTLTVGGKKIQSSIDSEDEEASEYLIEREHSVIKFYGQVPEWKEAWMRYYRIIFRDSCGRLMQVSYDLGQALAPDSKDHTELAQKIMDDLKYDFNCQYEEKDSIGRRYRRQDAIGTPFCITVDHDSLVDGCVTVRHRDSMAQERIKIEDLKAMIAKEVSLNNLLRNL